MYIYIYIYIYRATRTRQLATRKHRPPSLRVVVGGTQTGSYQTGSYQKGRFIPPEPKISYLLFFDTTPFICL